MIWAIVDRPQPNSIAYH